MGLKKTRIILSVILAAVMAASTLAGAFCLAMSCTYARQSFYEREWVTDELVGQCELQLGKKLEALSVKSGIPVEVFSAAGRDADSAEVLNQAISSVFNEYDSSLYTEERVDYFYSLCTMYLDANGYRYSKSDIRLVAEEAARIYSDCFGIFDADEFAAFAEERERDSNMFFAVFMMISLICIVLISVMHKEKIKGMIFVASSVITSGVAQVLTSIIMTLFGVKSDFDISPQAYYDTLVHLQDRFLVVNALIGIGLIVLGSALLFASLKQISIKNLRRSSRYYKILGKM